MSPRVVFQPIGEEIDCATDETVLDAAFRHGYNLVYGCREGQCSACKCHLLEGEVDLKPYSTFALSDSEQENGYSLMCRAMPEKDLVVELLHFDPENYRLENPIREGKATVETVEALTSDIRRLVLRVDEPEDFAFVPGQYVDLHIPGADRARRSFSMANLPTDGQIELIVKRYPGGRFSGMLDGELAPGAQLGFTGPYGAFHLRGGDRPILMIAGGSGMAPVLSVLRKLAADGTDRPVRFFYGARTAEDLFYGDVVEELGAGLADFRYVTVTDRFVHEAVDAYLEQDEDFAKPDVYMCGPPPMIDAAVDMLLAKHGVDEQRIFHDKFTVSADAGKEPEQAAAAPSTNGRPNERQFAWYQSRKRRATLYEDVTVDTQPSVHRHVVRGWPMRFADGRGLWSDSSTALRAGDWYAFRDPDEQWERPFYQRGTAVENQIDGAMRSATAEGVIADFTPEWVEFLRRYLQAPAYVEHGLWYATATAARDCLSDTVAHCVCLQAAMKQRSAQAIVLYAMDLEAHHGPFPIEDARERFLTEDPWQPTRQYLERLASLTDWGEVIVAANACFEPLVGMLIRRELGIRAAAANGDTMTPVLARVAMQEWEWMRTWTVEFLRFVGRDAEHGAANREIVAGWIGEWLPRAEQAAGALAAIAEELPVGIDIGQAAQEIRHYAAALLAEAELPELAELLGQERPPEAPAPRRVARTAPPAAERERAPSEPEAEAAPAARRLEEPDANGGGTYDYVGIVMAKSAEGDAVVAILADRDDVEVHEHPSFWDIRARDRLVINYHDVGDELGYEIGAYSIQHEMSTHYGRLVATDEALMLFSDPTEAMEYLMG